jgi:hypothetical protein
MHITNTREGLRFSRIIKNQSILLSTEELRSKTHKTDQTSDAISKYSNLKASLIKIPNQPHSRQPIGSPLSDKEGLDMAYKSHQHNYYDGHQTYT